MRFVIQVNDLYAKHGRAGSHQSHKLINDLQEARVYNRYHDAKLSSQRIERYLNLTSADNIKIIPIEFQIIDEV